MREECIEKVRREMEDRDIETFAVADQANLEYLTGVPDVSGVFVFARDDWQFFVPKFFRYSFDDVSRATIFSSSEERSQLLDDAIDDGVLTDDPDSFGDHELESADVMRAARLTKTAPEIEKIRKACNIGSEVFRSLATTFETGMTEWELVGVVDEEFRRSGTYNSFDTLVHANTLEPHREPRDDRIERGDTLLVDLGCRLNGYCSDMTRMLPNDLAGERERLVDDVAEIQQECLSMVRGGRSIADIGSRAEEVVVEKGYSPEDHYLHSLGHGVGVEIHEPPVVRAGNDTELEEGMVITIEPGLYVPGRGGARIEDQVVVREDGYERLTEEKRIYER